MKKVLFATTALIATASVAAADVRISGYGRFGLDYNDGNDSNVNGVSSTTITSRLRLQFDMSAETDSGVGFDARFRAQAESRDNVANGAGFNGARFGVTYQGFRVNVGNIIGAVENTPGTYLETRTAGLGIDGAGFVSHVGNVSNEYFNWDAYSSGGTGVNGVEALYSANGFTGHISYSQRNDSTVNPGVGNGAANAAARAAIMMAYTFGDWTVAGSYQDSDIAWEDKAIISVQGDLGQFGVRVAYADNDGIGKWGLYGNYEIGAASKIVAFVTSEDAVDAADVTAGRGDNRDGIAGSNLGEGESYGIHYSYDLGGGASFETGYRRASNDNDTFQAGVYFSF
ncbi:porin [Phaeobacter gallaeciensis]|uniref:Porin n=2 Tax=Roseobacteraceae TaxID=2854170 RepID=A0A366X5G3_9RHOB|nr:MULTISPECIES: porin [Roseobacteraceae]MBT3141908.1 porin [Falsiruegeria litorea]MBT8168745.1 porin [Falsiruegeria litorea]RBW59998.1 porin [Phaeobacter gallaeciensis]